MQGLASLGAGRAHAVFGKAPARPQAARPPPRHGALAAPSQRAPPLRRRRAAPPAAVPPELLGVAAFFAPGAAILAYAFYKGKGNLKDGLSRVLTEVSQGYFQPDVGGESIPVAEGELSDLAGDEPLFKALYKWWVLGWSGGGLRSARGGSRGGRGGGWRSQSIPGALSLSLGRRLVTRWPQV
jgi:hypothetical protein